MAHSSTSFRPGQSGNPAGRGTEDKLSRDAVRRAVKRQAADGKSTQLEALADKLVACALEGDISAMQEIGNRLDGKPTQQLNATVRDDSFIEALKAINKLGRNRERQEAERRLNGSATIVHDQEDSPAGGARLQGRQDCRSESEIALSNHVGRVAGRNLATAGRFSAWTVL